MAKRNYARQLPGSRLRLRDCILQLIVQQKKEKGFSWETPGGIAYEKGGKGKIDFIGQPPPPSLDILIFFKVCVLV